MDLKVHMQDP